MHRLLPCRHARMELQPMDTIPEWVRVVILATAGGTAKYLHGYLEGQPFHWRRLLASAAVSAFCGWQLADFISRLHPGWMMASAGFGGWAGAEGIRLVIQLAYKHIERRAESQDTKESE